jgi:formyltetrahydrofolate deformylase
MREHVDKEENRFFMRVEIEEYADAITLEEKLQTGLLEDATIKVDPSP